MYKMNQANMTQKIQAIKASFTNILIPFHVMRLMILELKYTKILNFMSTMLIKQN